MVKQLYRKLIVLHSSTSFLNRFLQQRQLLVYLSASHAAIASNLNALLENYDSKIVLPNSDKQVIWQQSCARLESLLAANKNKNNASLTIILGSDLLRFLILPAQQVNMSRQEKSAYAAAAFQEIYGVNANDWQLKYHDNAPNKPSIVAAIDKNLLSTINQIAAKHQLKLNSIQPYVMAAYNTSAKKLDKANAYFAIVEANRLTLMLIESGQYQQMRTHVIGEDWQTELKKTLLRENALSEATCRDVLIYAPMLKTKPMAVEGWAIKLIGQLKENFSITDNRIIPKALV
jgi:hypothetical protein